MLLINYCDIFIYISLSLLSAGRYYDALAQLAGIAISRLATVRSGPDRGLFWRPFKKTGPYGPAPPDCSSVPKILDQTVQSGLFIT